MLGMAWRSGGSRTAPTSIQGQDARFVLRRERRWGRVNPGPIWPCLASFTPSGEAENEATVASFGTPLTPTHCASWPWLWPWLASSGVARSGETFNSVAFGCISLLFLSSGPSPSPRGEGICPPSRGCEVLAFAGAFGDPLPPPWAPSPDASRRPLPYAGRGEYLPSRKRRGAFV